VFKVSKTEYFHSLCGLGMQYWKLLLPVILEARAAEIWGSQAGA